MTHDSVQVNEKDTTPDDGGWTGGLYHPLCPAAVRENIALHELQVTKPTLRELRREGRIPAIRINRQYRYLAEGLRRFLEGDDR